MPKNKKAGKKNGNDNATKDGQWVHVQPTELDKDSWEIVDRKATRVKATALLLDESDEDIVNLSADESLGTAHSTKKPPSKRCPEGKMDVDSEFDIIKAPKDSIYSKKTPDIEAEILEAFEQYDPNALKTPKVLDYKKVAQTLEKNETVQFKPSKIVVEKEKAEILKKIQVIKGISSEDNEKCQDEEVLKTDDHENAVDKANVRDLTEVGEPQTLHPNDLISSKPIDSEDVSIPETSKDIEMIPETAEDTKEPNKHVHFQETEVQGKLKEGSFSTFSKYKHARDEMTLSVLIAKDQTIDVVDEVEQMVDDYTGQSGEANGKGVYAAGQGDDDASVQDIDAPTQDVENEDSVTEGASQEKPSVPKMSKTAKRRKKQKEKMAKALEICDKLNGEEYELPLSEDAKVDDNTLKCSSCSDLYNQPSGVRKLTIGTTHETSGAMIRQHVGDEELKNKITQTYPVKPGSRSRSERKSKSKKAPIPDTVTEQLVGDIMNRLDQSKQFFQGSPLNLSRSQLQSLVFVMISIMSYLCTSITIRAMTYFVVSNHSTPTTDNSISTLFSFLVFGLYFYGLDKCYKKFQSLMGS